jgi:hypothetical protein
LSPRWTLSARTTPAAGAGTSIVALSVSSVISGVSTSIFWPTVTSTSMTLTSVNPPISGTVTTIGLAMMYA